MSCKISRDMLFCSNEPATRPFNKFARVSAENRRQETQASSDGNELGATPEDGCEEAREEAPI